jgi:hypothetical protein
VVSLRVEPLDEDDIDLPSDIALQQHRSVCLLLSPLKIPSAEQSGAYDVKVIR